MNYGKSSAPLASINPWKVPARLSKDSLRSFVSLKDPIRNQVDVKVKDS